MNWKEFKNKYSGKNDESKFILGVDFGSCATGIAYYDYNTEKAEIVDVSGGYGMASMPSAMQYIKDSKEWIFGEYAMLNVGSDEITFDKLIDNAGKMMYYDVDGKLMSHSAVLSLYIKEIINNVKNVNPNADVVGIIASVPTYINEDARQEIKTAFNIAGLEKALIDIVDEQSGLLYDYCTENNTDAETVAVVDYGYNGLRAVVYDVNGRIFEATAHFFDESAGIKEYEAMMKDLFKKYYIEKTKKDSLETQEELQLDLFTYQHKDIAIKGVKNQKLYFNFAYPPFVCSVPQQELLEITAVFENKLKIFADNLLKSVKDRSLSAVFCSGGGFDKPWAREAFQQSFSECGFNKRKNYKSTAAEGVCLMAAGVLGVCGLYEFELEESSQIKYDIGVMLDKKRFLPIMERNTFYNQKTEKKYFIVNEAVEGDVMIDIYRRSREGDLSFFNSLKIDGLPKRPRGTTRLSLEMYYDEAVGLTAKICDCGFGELFPSSGAVMNCNLETAQG